MSINNTYAGRDVINAPDIKKSIHKRSTERNDAPDTSAWLKNHFFRYVIGNLKVEAPHLLQIKTPQQAQEQLKTSDLPDWINTCLKQNDDSKDLWWINPESEQLLTLESQLVEFLSSRKGTSLEGKLMRINCMQALDLLEREHAIFESKAAIYWQEHRPDAVKALWQDERGVFVELRPESPELRAEMAYESQMMRHCLGQFANKREMSGGYGEHYAESCEEGKMRLFSYRTGQAQPRITISTIVQSDGKLLVEQIKGKQNKAPVARYLPAVSNFLNTLDTTPETPQDAINMGVVNINKQWRSIDSIDQEEEQLFVINRHPELIKSLRSPTLFAQWLIAAKHPRLYKVNEVNPSVAKALQGIPAT